MKNVLNKKILLLVMAKWVKQLLKPVSWCLSVMCYQVTTDASHTTHLISLLYPSLKREPTQITTLWRLEICVKSRVVNSRVTGF